MNSKQRNVWIILIILISSGIFYLWYINDGNYREKIKAIEKERDALIMEVAKIEYRYDSLEKVKQKVKWKYKETKDKLTSQENETDAIPGIVATYTNRMLDSILTNYRFVKRAKSGDSDRP